MTNLSEDKLSWVTGSFDRPTVSALVIVAVALVVTVAAYGPGLPGPLFLDDVPQLQGLIDQNADDPATLLDQYITSSSGPFGRPVAMATFVGSAVAHGADIWWWKYQNVMIHLISGLLVFWLTSLLFRARRRHDDAWLWVTGAVAAAIWLLHPLHVSTVLFTVQRMTELSVLFVLGGLICYVKGRQRLLANDAKGWILIGLGFVVFFPLGVLSKESALMFPAYCSLIEIFIFRFEGRAAAPKQVKLFHGAIALGFSLAAVYLLANFSALVTDAYAVRDFGLFERLYTECRVMVRYLSQILLPVQSRMGFFHDDIQVSTSLVAPFTTLLSAIVLVALAAGAVRLRTRLPLLAFGVLFFLLSHALESSIFALELMFEHRNYLPSIGIIIAAVAALQALIKNPRALILMVVLGLSGLSLLTLQRATTWASPASMYQFMHYAHPQSPRLNLIFANFYTAAENYGEARKSLAAMTTGLGPAVHGLFLDCVQHGQVHEKDIRDVALRPGGWLSGHVASSVEVLAQASFEGKCSVPKEASVQLIDHILALPARSVTDQQTLLISKARILESQNDLDAAVGALRSAYELRPDSALPLYLAAHSLSVAGRLDEAAEILSSAYEVERTSRRHNKGIARTIYLNIGNLYTADGEIEKAISVYSEAILSIPNEALFYVKKTDLLIRLQRYDDARRTLTGLRTLDAMDIGQHEGVARQQERFLEGLGSE